MAPHPSVTPCSTACRSGSLRSSVCSEFARVLAGTSDRSRLGPNESPLPSIKLLQRTKVEPSRSDPNRFGGRLDSDDLTPTGD